MKKSLILVIALVALFAMASAAYASTYSTYAAWSSAAPNNAPATPHDGYAVNTNKCAVCHAVHKANASGEILLRSSAADACTYCHIDNAFGNIVVYNGDSTAYTSGAPTVAQSFGGGFAHNSGGANCTNCHAVHGAQTLDGGNDGKILKDWTYWAEDGAAGFHYYSTAALAKWPTPDTVADKYAQQTAWCTGCHKYFIEAYDESSTANTYNEYVPATFSYVWATAGSHVMTETHSVYGNPAASTPDTQVAWAPSTTCRSCHNAGAVDTAGGTVLNSWPHYTPDYYRFMGVGANAGVDASAAAASNTTGTVDGLCLKCHIDSTGTQGVNLSF